MRALVCLLLAIGAPALAEVRDEHIVIGPEQVWIEVVDPIEVMWVGPNQYDRTQVLSGYDVEAVAFVTDPQDADMLGARAIVAVQPGTHSCENLKDPRDYHVVTLGPALATDGPFTACGELSVTLVDGAILLEEDPMRAFTEDGGQFIYWVPGRGFTDRLE
jgi:hypothetical protein